MTYQPTVLVVDDTPENIDLVVGLLGGRYRVLVATQGQEAIEVCQRQSPDLILLDVMMPGMNGHEVCRRLKADPRTRAIPVLFVTAMTDPENEETGLELGAVDYLHKPINAAILLQRVRIHLDLHNQQQALERMVRERTRELEATRAEIVMGLGRAAEFRDNETGMHILRMSHASFRLAQAAGFPEHEAELLAMAAQMHDIGKIGIPDHILLKPGRLSPDEWEVMKTHCAIGAEIIGNHNTPLLRQAREIALSHHEKWDGTGYPRGLKGEEIPLSGRIVALADVYDALVSKRPYKEAWSHEAATDYLRAECGRSFDPQLCPFFLEQMPAIREVNSRYQD